MNILLINHYAGSPKLGMEFRPYYLAKNWIEAGHDVTIIAANYSHIRRVNPTLSADIQEEIIDNIRYLWVDTPQYEGNGIGRINNMITFIRKLMFKASYIANKYKPDIVIASSTYPSDNYVAKKISKLSKAKYIYEVHDLWPLSPMELGGMSKYHPFIVAMQHAENFAYRKADAVVSMLPKTKEYMMGRGLSPDKWFYIPNGFVKEEWEQPVDLNGETRKQVQKIKEKFNVLVGYVGTLGLANALSSFVDAAALKPDVGFVMVGKGPEKERLKKTVVQQNLSNVFILEAVSKQEIPALLSLFDFLYIGLQSQPLFRFGISPNKMIDYMMAAKPIIQAIDAGNNMVEEAGCGVAIEPENPKAIVSALIQLMSMSKEKLNAMGKRGRDYALQHHDYKILAQRFIDIMKKI